MPDIPGFGAITITLMEEPFVDFRCANKGCNMRSITKIPHKGCVCVLF